MGTLITTVSALLGKSTVKSLKTQVGSSFYVGLIAPPSSGKSAAITPMLVAINQLETFLEIDASMLINAPTMEALSKFCSNTPTILCNLTI